MGNGVTRCLGQIFLFSSRSEMKTWKMGIKGKWGTGGMYNCQKLFWPATNEKVKTVLSSPFCPRDFIPCRPKAKSVLRALFRRDLLRDIKYAGWEPFAYDWLEAKTSSSSSFSADYYLIDVPCKLRSRTPWQGGIRDKTAITPLKVRAPNSDLFPVWNVSKSRD